MERWSLRSSIATYDVEASCVRAQSYSYDGLGRLSSGGANAESLSYGYDGISRLNSISYSFNGNAGSNNVLQFQYDPAGQVIWKQNTNSGWDWNPSTGNSSFAYGVDHLNRYTSAGSAAIYYDSKGDLTGDGAGASYRYNGHNWLMSSNNGASLNYDALGRLYSVTANGATTNFLYDGSALMGEYDANNNSLRRYVPGDGADDYVSWVDNVKYGRLALLPDPQGSILATANTSGQPQSINSYDDYGVPGSSNLGRIGYTGQVYLPEVGLYNFKARTYSPTLGRFLQTDPAGYADGLNWYNYAHSNPINGTDPTGTQDSTTVATVVVTGHKPDDDDSAASTVGAIIADIFSFNFGHLFGHHHKSSVPRVNTNSANPCATGHITDPARSGNAPSVSDYENAGSSVLALGGPLSPLGASVYGAVSLHFRHNGILDAQAYQNGSQSYANYGFGLFNAAAGIPVHLALKEASIYGQGKYVDSPQRINPTYGIPDVNVENIKRAYTDYSKGNTCQR